MNIFKILTVIIQCPTIFFVNADEENLLVETRSGVVKGRRGSTEDLNTTYYAFQGIPYAEPPLGDLRFSAPVPSSNWSEILDATADRVKCTQDFVEGSEDCLFISVYTPSLTPLTPLPVMVWIYGGFFLEGQSAYQAFGPDYFLDENVIIVTFNYRLGVFGFLSTEDEAATGNWALKDQILALKWVQDNIEFFGGDSSMVTLFGESAGSAAVSYLVQTPLTQNLFRGAIMQSGVSLDLWSLSRNPRDNVFKVGKALGINTTDSNYLIEQLRKVDAKKLETVSTAVDIGETISSNPRDGLIFAPSIEPAHEGAVVVNKSHELLKNGAYRKIPMIVGFNSNEGIPFAAVLDKLKLYLVSYDLFPSRLIPIDMNIDLNWLERDWLALQIKTHYFGLLPVSITNVELTQYITDDQFVRGTTEAVRLMSKYAPVYYYRFSYQGDLGLDAGSPERIAPGVGHGEDLNYIWKKSTNINNASRADLLTRRRLIKLWTNFAKTGNPTPEKQSVLQNVTWYPAKPGKIKYLDIGVNLTMAKDLSIYSINWWNLLYKQYGEPPYDTY